MGRDRLGGGDVEGLLAGSIAPDDAPPGYAAVAQLLDAARARHRRPAELDPDLQTRLTAAVVASRDGAAGNRLRRRAGRKAALGVVVIAAATSGLAAAEVIPLTRFGAVTGVRDGGAGSGSSRQPPGADHTVEKRDSGAQVATVPGEPVASAVAPLPAAPASPAQAGPSSSVGGAAVARPPQAAPAPATRWVPPGQVRKDPDAAPQQGGPPAHAGNGNGNGNGWGNANGRGNGNANGHDKQEERGRGKG